MKKWIVLLLLLGALMLAGCDSDPVQEVTPGPTIPVSEHPVVTVADIVDRAAEENLPTDTALECFWSDESYDYYFSTIRSHYVIAHYSDGTEEPIKAALEAGRVTLADLDRFGIKYSTEAIIYVTDIIDRTETEHLLTADALEGFWSDEEYHYYFSSIKSHYIIVHYSDGTQEPVREAMGAGRVTLGDLDRFGIGYYKEEIVTAVGMECKEGVLDALGLFWSDEEYDYYFPNCDTEVTVLLSDGHSWPLQDALMEELVTVSDLDRYGIRYYKEAKSE